MADLVISPTGAGDATGLSPSAGSNWENVDEYPTPDDGTTYNSGDAYDLYALANHTTETDPISNVRVYFRFASSTGANATGNSKIKIGGSEYNGSAETTITYNTYFTDYAQNPQSSAAWTWTNIDDLQAGAYVAAGGSPVGRLTQVYVVVTHEAAAPEGTIIPQIMHHRRMIGAS